MAAGHDGFTLLELLVALTLTAFLTLAAFGSLNVSLKALTRGQAEAERLQEIRVARDILERSLSSAVQTAVNKRSYFQGEPRQVRFFTTLPLEAYNLGGIYHWRLLKGQDESGQGVLAVEQVKDINWVKDPEGVEVRQIILRGVDSFSLVYGRGSEEFGIWDGTKVRRLPDWVKVRLAMVGQEPQEWVISLHVARNTRGLR